MKTTKDYLRSLDYIRKPHLPEDITTYLDCMKEDYAKLNAIHDLPFICSDKFAEHGFYTDVFDEYKKIDDEGTIIFHPQYWVTEHEGFWYLINNEGYNYARYVIELKNYSRPEPKRIKFIPNQISL
tara:strand:+ start:2568 stop:2945 length:378 start_codon:yes stop_codon:yes gene_type:complete